MKTYELPVGNIISVGDVPFRCLEDPLQRRFIGRKASGIYDTSFLRIMKCDVDICKDLYANVVSQLHAPSDLRAHDQGDHCVGTIFDGIKVVVLPAREYSVRIGGVILSSLCAFQQLWTVEGKYEESGLREHMTQIMFETLNVPAMYVAIQAVLLPFASKRTTGIVVNSCDVASHTGPSTRRREAAVFFRGNVRNRDG